MVKKCYTRNLKWMKHFMLVGGATSPMTGFGDQGVSGDFSIKSESLVIITSDGPWPIAILLTAGVVMSINKGFIFL
jgi:hypothetical protein